MTTKQRLVLIAADSERTYHESVEVTHWKAARFIHVKPHGPLSQNDLDQLISGFTEYIQDHEDKPIIMVGDYFDVEIYVLGEEDDAS